MSNPRYTTAFIGITLSGEIYVIRQSKWNTLIECSRWRRQHREEITKLYGEVRETTLEIPKNKQQ